MAHMKRKRQSSGIRRPPATVQESVTQSVPPEIIFELLVRLPVKSLCRFRCVSKLWNSMISSRRFVESHLALWSSRPEKLLISCQSFSYDDPPVRYRGCLIQHPVVSPLSFYTLTYSGMDALLDPTFKVHEGTERRSCFRIRKDYSQSLGGLTLGMLDSSIKTYNPSTREVVAHVTGQTSDGSSVGRCFFGFDPVGKVHKILAIFLSRNNRNEQMMDYRVLTLDGENKWRPIHDFGDAQVCFPHSNGNSICINGVVYYLAYRAEQQDLPYRAELRVLVGFDVRKESFRVIKFPSAIVWTFQFSSLVRLVKLQDRVAYADDDCLAYGVDTDLWLFQGFDEEVPWICRKISLPASWKNFRLRYVGTTQTGKFLFFPRCVASPNDCELFCYDWITGAARRTQVAGLHDTLAELYCFKKDSELYYMDAAVLLVNEHVESLWSARDLQGRVP